MSKESGTAFDAQRQAVIAAAERMDWQQVVLNGGPPCFAVCEDGRFCGRAERWAGHEDLHKFVSLADLIRAVQSWPSSRTTALRQSSNAPVRGGYTIGCGQRSITCHTCGQTSWNLADVEHKYCGFCHKFHQ
ncbi:MAG TPA: hypothetical protein VHA37_04455 [Candidatus Saccharimonadales bacterium]|nr:hypothetical protein [Candidatus Saccharimonadales bacterium]